jgi:hypothetical protein
MNLAERSISSAVLVRQLILHARKTDNINSLAGVPYYYYYCCCCFGIRQIGPSSHNDRFTAVFFLFRIEQQAVLKMAVKRK